MARVNSYDKSYSDKYLKRMKIERVGPLLDQMVIDDISPLKMLEMEFDIANPTVRKLRNMNPTVSHNTLNKFCYIIGYYLHQETVAVENYQKHVQERELWLKKLCEMKERYHKIYGESADDVEDLIRKKIDLRKFVTQGIKIGRAHV